MGMNKFGAAHRARAWRGFRERDSYGPRGDAEGGGAGHNARDQTFKPAGSACDRAPEVVGTRCPRSVLVSADARRHCAERGAAVDRARSRVGAVRPRVGRQRLHARARSAAACRRQARRHAREQADLPLGPRRLQRCLARGRARPEWGVADRRARAPGRRGGADDAGVAGDHLEQLPGAAAGDGCRHLGRRFRWRSRARSAPRCRPDTNARLGVDSFSTSRSVCSAWRSDG